MIFGTDRRIYDTYLKKVKEAEDYKNLNLCAIARHLKTLEKNKILKTIPNMIKAGYVIWCRNAEVCFEATPCLKLNCKYKKDRNDFLKGCSKCNKFAFGSNGLDWSSAKILYMGDV